MPSVAIRAVEKASPPDSLAPRPVVAKPKSCPLARGTDGSNPSPSRKEIGPDDEAVLSRLLDEGLATCDMVILSGGSDRSTGRVRRAVQQGFQPGLAVDQGQSGDVLALDEQQIE
jgi:hypothetical protein